MENQQREIVQGTLGMFQRYGIRSVTMDDVAGEMGVSKKTIYKFFDNKADLVHQSVISLFTCVKSRLEGVHANAVNAIDELIAIDDIVGSIMESHNPSLRYQLKKYYPQTYNQFYCGRKDMLTRMISENMELGIKDGWYREDACVEIISQLYCAKLEAMPEEEEQLFSKYPIRYLMRQSMEYHIRGIASCKGLEYLETVLEKEKNTQNDD